MERIYCYNCNTKGHLASNCPHKALFCSLLGPAQAQAQQQERVCHQGTVNGIYTQDIVVDTGASKTLVHADFVTTADLLEGDITIACAHGDLVRYPLGAVKFTLGGREFIATAAVADKLPVAALLGWDVPHLMNLVKLPPPAALAAVTRQMEKSEGHPWASTPIAEPANASNHQDQSPLLNKEENHIFELNDNLFAPPKPDHPRLTRAQKCQNRRAHTAMSPSPTALAPEEIQPLDISADHLRELQQEDPTLTHAHEVADGKPSTIAGSGYF